MLQCEVSQEQDWNAEWNPEQRGGGQTPHDGWSLRGRCLRPSPTCTDRSKREAGQNQPGGAHVAALVELGPCGRCAAQ